MNNNVNTPSKEDIILRDGTVVPVSYTDFYNYYVIEGHTQKECHKHFDIPRRIVPKIVEYFELAEEAKKNHWKPPVSAEDIDKVYLQTDIDGREAARQLNIGFSVFRRCLNYYEIKKSHEKVKENCARVAREKRQRQGITYELLCDYYVTKNMSQDEIANLLHCSRKKVCKMLKQFNVVKPDEQIQQKRKETTFARYGVSNAMQSPAVRAKANDTNIERYGVPHVMQSPKYQENLRQIRLKNGPAAYKIQHAEQWSSDEAFRIFVTSCEKKQTGYQLSEYFNIDYSTLMERIHRLKLESAIEYYPMRSHYEDEIVSLLKDYFHIADIRTNVRGLLPSKKEIDIYLPDYKLGIEFNGEYWHSEANEKYSDHSGRSVYHQEKSLEAEQQGIFLFHIFEHEWNDLWISKNKKFANSRSNIINRLGNLLQTASHKVPARACVIKSVSKQETKEFLNENHIQGAGHAAQTYGLYYNDKLVSCMCFIGSKYKKYTYELSRFASAHDTVVQGGASKLFKYFVNNILKDGETIVSYNDITKTKGTLYQTLGFQCVSVNDPNYWWVNFDTYDIRSRYQEQSAGEVQRMHDLGYNRICDCGTRTWVYTKF